MIPEYHLLIAGLIGGTGLGLLIGCVLGWILRRWKQESDELVRQAEKRQKWGKWSPPESFNCRCKLVDVKRSTNGDETRTYSNGPKPEGGNGKDEPERPFTRNASGLIEEMDRAIETVRGLRADMVIVDDPLCPDHIEVSEQILVDRDELLVLCDRVITHGLWMYDSDAPDRARQMMEKIGRRLREEGRA